VQINANDLVTAIQNQRNGALNESAHLYALLELAKREISELKAKYEPHAESKSAE